MKLDAKKCRFLLLIILFLAIIPPGTSTSFDSQKSNITKANESQAIKDPMSIVFEDPSFSFELLRVMGYSEYGTADIGECVTTARRIKDGDFESWYSEWYETAQRITKLLMIVCKKDIMLALGMPT